VEGDIFEVDITEDNEALLVNVNKPAKQTKKKKEEN
jgi:hypothetical protein